MPEAQDGLGDDPDRDRQQRCAVQERSQDLPSEIAVRLLRRLRLPAEPHDEEREPERGDIRQHVARVGEQRQGVGEHAPDDFDHQEQRGQRQGDLQPPACPLLSMCRTPGVTVAGPVVVRGWWPSPWLWP